MDWNLKTSSWDLTEFVPETNPNTNLVCGSSSFGSQGIIKGDFSVDLKLGQVVDLRNESSATANTELLRAPSAPKMAVSPSGSSKRARAALNNGGVQTASCLVDGCKADLSICREYHRRHKVCELHSKTPQVTIGGHKQRFCQQCSRFHSLEEFDDEKRSCRKRLDGHNRRRRKPQPEPRSHTESFLPNYHQDSRLFPFSSPHAYSTNAVANPVWTGVVKSEQHKLYNHHHQQQQQQHMPLLEKQSPFSGSSSSSYGGGGGGGEKQQFSFLQGTTLALGNQTVQEAFLKAPPVANSSESGGSRGEIFCGDLSNQTLNSDCALSLLSSPPTQTSVGISGLSHMLPPDSIPLAQSLGMSMQYNTLEPLSSSLGLSNAGETGIHCSGIFQMGGHHEAPSSNESPQTLPFYWD